MSTQATPPTPFRELALRAGLSAAAILWLAQPAVAQLRQYAEPGRLAERQIPTRDSLRERMAQAPWQAGKWRLQPRLSIGNLVYSNNVFDDTVESEQTSDLRGSASAGLEAYAPLGDDVVFATFLRPSYSWWRDNDQLSRFNSSYGAALFGLFNRVSTEVSFRRTEVERPINNELRIPAVVREDGVAFDARVTLRGPWQLFGSVGLSESGYPEAAELSSRVPGLDLLARDEEVVSTGLAYEIPDRFRLGIGWRRVETNFEQDPELRSNSGEYPFLTITLPGNKVQLDGTIGQRLLEFDSTSGLSETEEAIGTLRATFEVGRRTSFTVFTARDIVYSAVDAGGFFSSQRFGAALAWGESGSLRASLFAETGEDSFSSAGGTNLGRVDDGESYGVQFELPLRWGLELNLGIAETTIDSTFDEFDRSLTSVSSSVSLDLPDFPF